MPPKTCRSYSQKPVRVTSYGRRDFADVIISKLAEIGKLFQVVQLALQCTTSNPIREGKGRFDMEEEGNVKGGRVFEVATLLALRMEEGTPKLAAHQIWGRQRTGFPLGPLEGVWPC